MVGRTLAHYEIRARLGSGGMGEVYQARDLKLDRDVALKILSSELARDPERRRRFEREAKTVASLNHAGIITVFSVEESEGIHFFTMELVEGHSLASEVSRRGIALDDFYEIALPLTDALAAAHDTGVTHRDLKPGNIMVSDSGQLKILDFGLAKHEAPPEDMADSRTAEQSREGLIFGTLPYMSPEQVEGESVEGTSDIFSVGVLFFELLTGERPFQGKNPAALVSAILRDAPPLLSELRPDLPREITELVRQCLEKDPGQRPPSARYLHERLSRTRQQGGSPQVERIHSIAVLPFTDLSPDRDQDYFCEGIVEELVGGLTRIKNLRVASRTSSQLFKERAADVREIGQQLDVETVLEGSVRKAGDQLRITAQLINTADDDHLWSKRYDRELKDIFVIQEEITQDIVQALKMTLSPGEVRSLRAAPTSDVQAYEYYLRGRRLFYQFRRRGIEMALQMYSLAIKHDDKFALAYAGTADCWSFFYIYADKIAESLAQAEAASRRALELDPALAEAYASRGQVLSLSQKHHEAEAAFQMSLRLGPRLFEAYYLYARDCFAQGKLEQAAELFEQAAELRPDDYQSSLLVAQIYDALGQSSRAAAVRRRGVRIVEERLKLNPGDVRALYMGANGLVALGEHDQGLEWANLALGMEPNEPMVLYNVACIQSLTGRSESALDCLERALAAGLSQKGWFDNDSNLDPLRDSPRFRAMMKRLGKGPQG